MTRTWGSQESKPIENESWFTSICSLFCFPAVLYDALYVVTPKNKQKQFFALTQKLHWARLTSEILVETSRKIWVLTVHLKVELICSNVISLALSHRIAWWPEVVVSRSGGFASERWETLGQRKAVFGGEPRELSPIFWWPLTGLVRRAVFAFGGGFFCPPSQAHVSGWMEFC